MKEGWDGAGMPAEAEAAEPRQMRNKMITTEKNLEIL
jgi:hypothetical protein